MSSIYSHQVNTDIYNVHSVHSIILLAALDQFLYIFRKFQSIDLSHGLPFDQSPCKATFYMLKDLVLMTLSVRMIVVIYTLIWRALSNLKPRG